jgi:hypothetical protein
MPTRFLILTAVLLLGLATSARARLGETETAVEERYGKPTFKYIKPWCVEETYSMNGFTIVVTFIDGVSQGEKYTLPAQELSAQQVNDLLTANSEGYLWDEVPKSDVVPPAKQMWKKPNGSTAVLTAFSIEFKSADLIAAAAKAEPPKQPTAPSTQGF